MSDNAHETRQVGHTGKIGPELLSTKEVANELRVSPRTILRWSDTGILNPIRLGQTLRFRADKIAEIIK